MYLAARGALEIAGALARVALFDVALEQAVLPK